MARVKSLTDLFLDEVRDLFDAEEQLLKALPKMANAAASDELRAAIESHLEQSRTHVTRLEQVFRLLEHRATGTHCAGIAGIIEEASDLLRQDIDDAALDAGITAGAQRAECYEIGAYGSLIAWARALGKDEVAEILTETLEEEEAADRRLSALAQGGLDAQAAALSAEGDAGQDEEADDSAAPTTSASHRPRASGNGEARGMPSEAGRSAGPTRH